MTGFQSTNPTSTPSATTPSATTPSLVYCEYQENVTTPQLAELAQQCFINWTPKLDQKKNKWLKVPVQRTNNPLTHLSLRAALEQDRHIGLVCNDLHPIIALDVDGMALTEEPLHSLLREHPTYIEHSPSGKPNYYRILYQLPTSADKSYLRSKTTFVHPEFPQCKIDFFNSSQNYITLTGQTLDVVETTTGINSITPEQLIKKFPQFAVTSQAKAEVNVTNVAQAQAQQLGFQAPAISLQQWSSLVKCDRNDPLVQKYCSKHSLSYYDFWLQGLMAIHAANPGMAGLEAANAWSQQSDEYDSQELVQKWSSFTDDPSLLEDHQITIGTYIYMYNQLVIQWPYTNKNGSPSLVCYENFKYFVDAVGLDFTFDAITKRLVLIGPDSLLIPRFYRDKQDYYTRSLSQESIVDPLYDLAVSYNYAPEPDRIRGYLRTILGAREQYNRVNRMEEFLMEQPPYDPSTEPDYLDIIFGDCLINDPDHPKYYPNPDRAFRVRLGRLWARSLLRTFDRLPIKYPHLRKIPAEGMLILSGDQRTGKTMFVRNFFPEQFGRYVFEMTTDAGQMTRSGPTKDYRIGSTASLLVNFDECGWLFKYTQQASDFIKQEVTGMVDTYRPLYATDMIECPRRYSIVGTTNDSTVQLPREGARRFFWINITDIDRDRYNNIDKVRVLKQIEWEIAQHDDPKVAPWALLEKDCKILTSYLCAHQTTSNLEEILEEVFNTSEYAIKKRLQELEQQDGDDFRGMTSCVQDIIQMCNFDNSTRPKLKELKLTLGRFLSRCMPEVWYFKRTKFVYGIPPKRGKQQRFLLPPLRSAEGYDDPSEY